MHKLETMRDSIVKVKEVMVKKRSEFCKMEVKN